MSSVDRRKPSGSNRTLRRGESGATHPALPAVVLLVCFAVFMAAIAPLDFTSIFHKFFPTPIQKVPHQDAAVWVDKTSGVYYCATSMMFGKTPGQNMRQVEALDRGYQPALGTYCDGPAWSVPEVASRPAAPAPSSSAGKALVPPSTFENPNYKPQVRNTPPVSGPPGQTYLPH